MDIFLSRKNRPLSKLHLLLNFGVALISRMLIYSRVNCASRNSRALNLNKICWFGKRSNEKLETSLFVAVIISLGAIFLTAAHLGGYFKEEISWINSSFHAILSFPFKAANHIKTSISTYQALLHENQQLKKENLMLQARLQPFSALLSENKRLHALLGASSPFAHQIAIAEVLAIAPDPFSHRIILNKGKKHQVYVGQPLVDAAGVIGQITEVTQHKSHAILITDPQHALPAQALRNNSRVLLMGTGTLNHLEIPFISDASQLAVGDILVTSSLGQRFPPGYPVAKITSISREKDQAFIKISAKPLARLDQIQQVLLIWPK